MNKEVGGWVGGGDGHGHGGVEVMAHSGSSIGDIGAGVTEPLAGISASVV